MLLNIDDLIPLIHTSPRQIVLVLTGGSRAVAELLEVPGGSRTVLEVIVPYSDGPMIDLLGSRPEQFCCDRTATAMAVAAFARAVRHGAAETQAAGVACTASLATDRSKRGPHRIHVALQTASHTWRWSLELEKEARRRHEEEQIAARMILNAVAEACSVSGRLDLPLRDGEAVESNHIAAPQEWQDLFLGRKETQCIVHTAAADLDQKPEISAGYMGQALLSGAFNPLHVGHRGMADIAQDILGVPVASELSIHNVDKPTLDYLEIEFRLRQFPLDHEVWLTRAATFDDKSRLFPGATFIVGTDTLQRIADPRYYGNDTATMLAAIERIAGRGCRFLVFGRTIDSHFVQLSDLDMPDMLRRLCTEIPPERFRMDVSSTALRKKL